MIFTLILIAISFYNHFSFTAPLLVAIIILDVIVTEAVMHFLKVEEKILEDA